MTKRQGAARDIDNAKLAGLYSGTAYIPNLNIAVHWEGFGERALLLTRSRVNSPVKRLRHIVSQPETVWLKVGGRRTRYTPDFEFEFDPPPNVIWEAKGAWALAKPAVQEKLQAAELYYASVGKQFRIFNSTEGSYGAELRNVEMLRPYARVAVSPEREAWLVAMVRAASGLQLRVLAEAAATEGVGRRAIYALMFRDVLAFDWTKVLRESTVITA